MGRSKILLLGSFFCVVGLSNVQAWHFEMPTPIPGVEVIIGSDPGFKLGLPFLGGTVKHVLTAKGIYNDTLWALRKGSNVVIEECLGGIPQGYTFSDIVGKRVTAVIALCKRDELLKEKLQLFYALKGALNKVESKEEKKVLQRKVIEAKYAIKRHIA